MKPFVVQRAFRFCRRCRRWRSIGNFSTGHGAFKRKTCMRCIPDGVDGRRLTVRNALSLTDKARAYLAAERMAVPA